MATWKKVDKLTTQIAKLVEAFDDEVLNLYDKLAETRDKIKETKAERERLRGKLAEMVCPYSVGDITICDGNTHHGKKCRIRRIDADVEDGVISWHVFCDIIKNNGEMSKLSSDWSRTVDESDLDY